MSYEALSAYQHLSPLQDPSERGDQPHLVPLGLPASCWGQSHCRAWPAQGMSRSWDAEHTAVLIGHGWDICSGHAALGLLSVTTWTVFQRRPFWVGLAGLAGLPAPLILLWGLQLTTLISEIISPHQLSQAASAPLYCAFVCPQPLRTCWGWISPFWKGVGMAAEGRGPLLTGHGNH